MLTPSKFVDQVTQYVFPKATHPEGVLRLEALKIRILVTPYNHLADLRSSFRDSRF